MLRGWFWACPIASHYPYLWADVGKNRLRANGEESSLFTVPTRLLHPSNLHSSDRLGSCPCVEHYVLHLFSMHVSLMFSADETKHISSSSNGFLKEQQSRCVAVDWPSGGNKKCLCPPSGCMTRLFGTDHRGTARLGIRIGIISPCILLLVRHGANVQKKFDGRT